MALVGFYIGKFPEYVKNDLYISGESYAGIYVPYLALKIHNYNLKAPEGGFKMNLKGFIVGNGVTNWKYDGIPAYVEMGFWHSLYDLDLYDKYQKYGCAKQFEYFEFNYQDIDNNCWDVFNNFTAMTENVNVYDIYGICYNATSEPKYSYDIFTTSETAFRKLGNSLRTHRKYFTAMDYTPWMHPKVSRNGEKPKLKDLPPCTFGQPIIDYLNN